MFFIANNVNIISLNEKCACVCENLRVNDCAKLYLKLTEREKLKISSAVCK